MIQLEISQRENIENNDIYSLLKKKTILETNDQKLVRKKWLKTKLIHHTIFPVNI